METRSTTGLGPALAERRRQLGLNREEAARRAGLSLNTVMKVEQGRTLDPGLFKVAALCRALDASLDDVVDEALSTGGEPTMSHGIVSIGYEGRTIEEFVLALRKHNVSTVADVRLTPLSRKHGFSKTRLTEVLAEAGIAYRHLRALGNQKDNRAPFSDGRIEEGRKVFAATLSSDTAASALSELGNLVDEGVVAVVCFEADQRACHRHVVIEEIRDAHGVRVIQA